MPERTLTPVPTHTAADARRRRIGESIAEARQQRQLTRADLAGAIGVPERTVARWEASKADVTFEAALAIEQIAGWERGALGADGAYFAYSTAGASNEQLIDSREYDTFSEMLSELQAAEVLGLGVRVRNEFVPDGDLDEDHEYVTLTMAWTLELYERPPQRGESLDA